MDVSMLETFAVIRNSLFHIAFKKELEVLVLKMIIISVH